MASIDDHRDFDTVKRALAVLGFSDMEVRVSVCVCMGMKVWIFRHGSAGECMCVCMGMEL